MDDIRYFHLDTTGKGNEFMLIGVKYKANPTDKQRKTLSEWMGCARFIWNAKCEEHHYFTVFARNYCPIGTYAPIDQTTSQFKHDELSPWLSRCPSQILRNSASNWYKTYQNYMQGQCGKPKRKRKTDKGSIHLTRELFKFEVGEDGVTRLFVGTKTNNIGYLSFKGHRPFKEPKSLYIRKEAGIYTVSFAYEDDTHVLTDKEQLDELREESKEYLEAHSVGVDRGVVVPAYAGDSQYDLSIRQKKKQEKRKKYIKRMQKRLARQHKGSNRRAKTKHTLARTHKKIANMRHDFCHKTSRALVDSDAKVIFFEELKTSNMTKKPKPKQDEAGKYLPNRAKQKAGLNRSILDVGWHQLESFTHYKAKAEGKACFKISAPYTSQECACCGHTHPDNRKKQELFVCGGCGHVDNADRNASLVIKKRGIAAILDPGTGLSGKGIPLLGTGRGAEHKTKTSKARLAAGKEASKKKRKLTATIAA